MLIKHNKTQIIKTIRDKYHPYMLRHRLAFFSEYAYFGTPVSKHVGVISWIVFYDL